MAEEQIQKLIAANIPEELWETCFVTEDGMIFTPWLDDEGNILDNGEKVYQKWLKNKEQIDICPPKTVEERLAEAEQENRLLKAQVEANTSTQEFLESCMMEMAQVVYA